MDSPPWSWVTRNKGQTSRRIKSEKILGMEEVTLGARAACIYLCSQVPAARTGLVEKSASIVPWKKTHCILSIKYLTKTQRFM